jgi:putative toxin-antitoxin system antitoxin component (TIGR02293 family)
MQLKVKDMAKSNEINILGNKGDKIGSLTLDKYGSYFIDKGRRRMEGTQSQGRSAKKGSVPLTDAYVLCFNETEPVFNYLGYNQKEVAEILEINASTIYRWKKSKKSEPLGKLQSKVILQIDEIIAKGIKIFGSEEGFKVWLDMPNYALGDIKPIELLKDPYNIEIVDNAIEAMSWGNIT